jgi:hypothetical protein
MYNLVIKKKKKDMGFQDIVYKQKHLLRKKLEKKMKECSSLLLGVMDYSDDVEGVLKAFACDNDISGRVYLLGADREQISSDVYVNGVNDKYLNKELDKKLFVSGESESFYISNTYISHTTLRPSVSAVHLIEGSKGVVGYLVLDILVRNIGGNDNLIDKKSMQLKGDPAIRENIFNSIRKMSEMDKKIDDVHSIANELVTNLGVFHIKMHYSSSRSTIWNIDNPFEYFVHTIDEILTPDVCLLYKATEYPKIATLSPSLIPLILEKFKYLRFMDDNIYLRAGSINIVNGMVGLNFSCDGSHYLNAEDFLEIAESEYGLA